mgnify:CR=1 FL=1
MKQYIFGNINNIRIIKKIGYGYFGTVYLVKDDKNHRYALKIEQVSPDFLVKSLRSFVWRENEFSKKMNKLYPNHFLKLHAHLIDNDCEHNQLTENNIDLNHKSNDPKFDKLRKHLSTLKSCSVKLWSIIDLTLHDILKKWKTFKIKTFNNIMIQLVYVIHLMNKHGYSHNDLHVGNIGLTKTNNKFINISGTKIKTYGYYVCVIDYGLILHKKYNLTSDEKNTIKYSNDLLYVILLIANIYFKNFKKTFPNIDITKDAKISKKYLIEINKYLPNEVQTKKAFKIKNFLLNVIYKVVYYDVYCKQIFKNDLSKIKKVQLRLDIMDINDFLFIVKNCYDVDKVLNHLLDK